MTTELHAQPDFWRQLGLFLLVGAVLGTIFGLGIATTYPNQRAVVYLQLGLVPDLQPSAMAAPSVSGNRRVMPLPGTPEPLALPNVKPIESWREIGARLTSQQFVEAIAKRLNRPELAASLSAGVDGKLYVRSVPTLEGGLIELSYASREPDGALTTLGAIVEELEAQHRPIFASASKPYLDYASELAADLANRESMLADIESGITTEPEPQSELLALKRLVAKDIVDGALQKLRDYNYRLDLVGVENTHMEGKPVVRKPLLSLFAVSAIVGALGGLVLGAVAFVVVARRFKI